MVGTLWWCCGAVELNLPLLMKNFGAGKEQQSLCCASPPHHQAILPIGDAALPPSQLALSKWCLGGGEGMWWWISQVQQGKTEKDVSACGLLLLWSVVAVDQGASFAGPQSGGQGNLRVEKMCRAFLFVYLSLRCWFFFCFFISYRSRLLGLAKASVVHSFLLPTTNLPVSPLPPF